MAATTGMATIEEVKDLLVKACPAGKGPSGKSYPAADVSTVTWDDLRITGEVRWDGFRGMSVRERHDYITRLVRDPLGYRGLRIGPLYLLTRREKLDG